MPSTSTRPALIGSRRLIIDSTVDLPAPLGPMMAVTPPAGRVSVTSSTTTVSA